MKTNKKMYIPTQFLCIAMAILCFSLALFTGLATYKHQETVQQNTVINPPPIPYVYDDSTAVMVSYKTYEPLERFNKLSIFEYFPAGLVREEYLNSDEDPKILSDEVAESMPPIPEESCAIESIIATTHTIRSGDSYCKLASKYYGWGGYCYALCKYNGVTTDTILHPGDTLLIPSVDDPTFSKMIMGLTGERLTNETIEYTYDDAYYHGTRTRAAVDINIPTGDNMKNYTGEVDTSSYRYLGDYYLTGYAPTCSHCCGGDTSGIGASGVTMIPGYSIAMSKDIPFGTTVYIEGYGYYVVEDRGGGVGPGHIDIACVDHNSCYTTVDRMYNVPVYIVD